MTKNCSECKQPKPEMDFLPGGKKCHDCKRAKVLAQKKRSYWKHRDKICAKWRQITVEQRPEVIEKRRNYYQANKEKLKAQKRAALKNPNSGAYQARFGKGRAHYLAQKRRHNQAARPQQREYRRKRWQTDISFRLKHALSRHLRDAISGESKSRKCLELLGCSLASFQLYLESKFDVGMSWENYGVGGWEIDHIMPLSIFDLTKPEHQKRAFHVSNLQPLWAADNRAKSNKVLDPQFPLI